ncbi:MAG: hypothetical protein HC767_12465 [Akkermansiaceae bacterium]|nr:hypothetical protein [Akkermansiaceae bacterium]
MKKIDDFTVHFVTKAPNPILPNQITQISIMSKVWAEKHKVEKPQDFKKIVRHLKQDPIVKNIYEAKSGRIGEGSSGMRPAPPLALLDCDHGHSLPDHCFSLLFFRIIEQ